VANIDKINQIAFAMQESYPPDRQKMGMYIKLLDYV
jgi:hypothetical protein